jgi:hypothetical protein
MGRPKGVKNKPKTNQMITLKLTKQEFGLLTEWSKRHFWDNTQSFEDDIDIDELLGWSRSCLLMARLKAIADDQGIHFGYDDFPTEDMAPAAVKTDRVTQLFIDQYTDNVAMLAKQKAKENG